MPAPADWPIHTLPHGPEALPAVRPRDLDHAWHAARAAALAETWGSRRGFRFHRPDGEVTELVLADPDACCWAAAIDRIAGLASASGLSLCLRLLALIDLLGRTPTLAARCRFARDGAELPPALLALAAATPLSPDAGFDPAPFHAALTAALPGVSA